MDYRDQYPEIGSLVGKTIAEIAGEVDGDEITFTTSDGRKYMLHHQQDCCEHVYIESIVGDLEDLVGEPLLVAEEAFDDTMGTLQPPDGYHESYSWTFYKFDTRKGGVTIRFFGSSNGYYGEKACLVRVA